MSADRDLVERVRATLVRAGDPERAASQQAYMKSEMPYRGIAAPELRRLLRPLLAAYKPTGRDAWAATVRSRDDDLWVRRTAVLSQVRHRDDTDRALLHDVVAANVADPSFWLRKAIGWALRELARTDPDWVRAEVDRLGPALSGMSRREALRHLT